jgi:hypothetical protein
MLGKHPTTELHVLKKVMDNTDKEDEDEDEDEGIYTFKRM